VTVEPDPAAFPVHERKAMDARGYSWETAQVGNYLGLKHGGWSQRIVGVIAQDLLVFLYEVAPDLAEPRYCFSTNAWARAEAQALVLTVLMDRELAEAKSGDDLPAQRTMRELATVENRAARLRESLGLDARSHAALARERVEVQHAVVDLDAIRARGREALLGRVVEVVEGDG
jgi:hypothetical protein